MISVVAYSLIEEAPNDIHFFWTISGYGELFRRYLLRPNYLPIHPSR